MYSVHYEIFIDHQSLKCLLLQKDLNLKQTRWLEVVNDYDINFRYHQGKENVVTDALSYRLYSTVLPISVAQRLCEDFRRLEINVVTRRDKHILLTMEVQPTLMEEIQIAQDVDPLLDIIKAEVLVGKAPRFIIHEEGTL